MANWFKQRMEREQGGPMPERPTATPPYPQPQQNLPASSPSTPQAVDVDQLEHTPENVLLLMNYWTGGEGTRTEKDRCPQCGGNHYFSRSQGTMRGPAPAPMCYTCGYNGMFEQADQATWSAP